MTTTQGALIGYARVSTGDQTLDLQRNALRGAGCFRIFEDTASGSTTTRPELDKLLAFVRPGDVLVVWKLDRLGRSLHHLVNTVNDLAGREVGFRSLSEAIDTTTPTGRLMLHLMMAFAEFERDLIRERTRAGLDAARERGVRLGRKPALTPDQKTLARRLVGEGASVTAVAETLNVSRGSVYRALSPA